MDNSGKFVWFLVGATIGASVALLYAPQSGDETRRYLRKKARESSRALGDLSEDALDRGRDLYEKGRRIADDAVDLFERGRRIVQS